MKTMQDGNSSAKHRCGDCGAEVGQLHRRGCDVETCADCGGQAISCECVHRTRPRLVWTGQMSGDAECIEFGWYAKLVKGKGWVPCSAGDEGAHPDVNRLFRDACWDADAGRFVLRQ